FRFCVVRVRRPPQPRVFPYTTLFRSTQLRPEERPLSGRRVGAPGRVPGGRRARARVGRQHARWSPCMTTACPALPASVAPGEARSEEHTSELQSRENLVCRLLLEKKK